jgi:PAS domain S-box-containing protein
VSGLFCACIETTEKVLAARKIAESERNLRNTILQSPVAMCILRGLQFHVEIANDHMYELWGKKREEVEKRPLFEGLPEARAQGFEELLTQVYTTGVTLSFDERPVSLPREQGLEVVYINFVYRPFFEGDGTISGVIAVAIDVSEQVKARKKIEESEQELQVKVTERTSALQEMNLELKRTNNNLEEFAYAASHDLKEPIRKIHFFSERLKDKLRDRMTGDELALFERMEKASTRMGLLVDDLLTYSQISKGVSNVEKIDLNDKLHNVLEDLELQVAEKSAIIQVGTLPVINGQKRQMQQLFQNLIGNALKYSKPGEAPVVKINAAKIKGSEAGRPLPQQDADKTFHLITVNDNGIGFEQKDADRIFNVFTRLHGNSEYRGTGVGLSIVRKVAENHGGYIWADSNPGEGATFSVLLPAE